MKEFFSTEAISLIRRHSDKTNQSIYFKDSVKSQIHATKGISTKTAFGFRKLSPINPLEKHARFPSTLYLCLEGT